MAERSSDGVLEYRSTGVLKERLVQRPTISITPLLQRLMFHSSLLLRKSRFFLVWPTSVP